MNESTGEGANDQHPDHDVRLGEALMKEVYEELRASPKVVFFAPIMSDHLLTALNLSSVEQHGSYHYVRRARYGPCSAVRCVPGALLRSGALRVGGFYDHVPPPMNIPAPDNSTSFPDKGFQFNRLGVRIPTLLISPWVAKGTVIGAPLPSEKPANNSEFDLTSVIATVRKLVGGTKPLTKRDAWAASFEGRLSEPEPRTDCPLTLPDAPKSLGAAHAAAEAAQPINDLQTDILKAFRTLAGKDEKTHPLPSLQGEAGPWIKEFVDQALAGEHIFSDQVVAP